jgi:leader peptidase (prepilin peptidase)/N-methyltransferase
VIYRLPEGINIVTPRSRCPRCEHDLAWYDNVPVLGWLWLRGKCRYCKEPISVQYPLVEATVGLMFAGLYAVYYMTLMRPQFVIDTGFGVTWAVFVVHLILLAGLFASTVIDAKLFIIPRSIPWTVTVVGVLVLPVAVWLEIRHFQRGLVPIATPTGITTAVGGLIGLGVSLLLLRLKVLPLSFADYEGAYEAHQKEHAGAEKEPWFHYPHARREVLKETLFLTPPAIGCLVGYLLAPTGDSVWPAISFTLGGVAMGYLFGAALVWVTRILGTLLFGKEAMGLGDVHLLAAIGVVLGPGETIPVFFLAPFFGLAAVLLMFGVGALVKKKFQPIPYGPYLAGAALVVMIWREPIVAFPPLRQLYDIFDSLFLT